MRFPLPDLSSAGRLAPAALALLTALGAARVHAQLKATPAEAVVAISAGQTMTLALKPREYQTVRVTAAPGKYTELRMELPAAGVRGNLVKVQPEPMTGPDAADAAISDSGQNFVRFPLIDNANLHVTVLTNSKADTDPIEVHFSLVSSEQTPEKAADAKALASFNHAERLRRSHVGAEKALPAYQQALTDARASRDAVLEQQVLLSAGRMLMLDGKHYSEAVEWERKAVAMTGTDSAASVQALAWKMLGGALLDMDQYAESLEASGRALALYEKTGETFWQGVVLENMGEAQLHLGDLPTALKTEERALELSRQLHDDFGVVEMLAELGSIHRTRGEYQAALDDFSEAVEITLPTEYNPMQGEAWLAMGELHRDVAEPQRADEDFSRSLSIAQHTSSGLDELESLQEIANLRLERGDWKAAQDGLSQALARARELKLVRPQSALLIGLARTNVASGHAAEAEPLLRQAIELAQGIHQRTETAEAYEVLGELAQSAGSLPEAKEDFARAAALYGEIPDKAGLAAADAKLAGVEAASGDVKAALEHLRQAMDIVESSRTSFARGALRTRFFAAQRATYDQAIALLMEQDRLHPDADFAAQAWRVAERARARSLLDELWADEPAANDDAARAELRQRLAALEVRISSLEEQQAQAGSDAGDLAAVTKIQSDLRAAVLAADELESRIRGAGPAAPVPVEQLSPAGFAGTALGQQDALVEYWVGTDASYVWLIRGDGSCSGYRLPAAAALLERTAAYRSALLSRNDSPAGETLGGRNARVAKADAASGQLAKSLAAMLLPEALQQRLENVHRLLLVADGPLAQVPFAGLKMAAAKGSEPYLVERFELLSEPSAAYLMANRSPKASAGAPLRVAVFADPVYNRADSRLAGVRPVALTKDAGRSARNAGLGNLPRLPGSRDEAMKIAAIAGPERSSVFAGFGATPAAVRGLDWTQYPIAHFAVHAISHTGGRDSAGLLLSMLDAQGQRRDGVLWVRDIYATHAARDLVVLSGCGTALGETIPGEGMNSLARGFLFSGTRQVAATLWPADDASSSTLMSRFYIDMLQRGMSAGEALREAQLNLMRQPQYAAPIYWAGFMVEGTWKAH